MESTFLVIKESRRLKKTVNIGVFKMAQPKARNMVESKEKKDVMLSKIPKTNMQINTH